MSILEFDGKISVITATYNAEKYLPRLIESLCNQEDKNFEWVVADGASSDKTLELLKGIDDLNIKITSQEDFGIYDALSRGIKACSGEFYLVMGADDILYPNGIKDYKAAIGEDVDIVTAWVDTANKEIMKPNKGPAWLSNQFHYISTHAVGALFRKSLHQRYGFYSRLFPIAADQLFILTACQRGAQCKPLEIVVGYYSDQGLSSTDMMGALTEDYRIMLMLNYNKPVQTLLFLKRLLRRFCMMSKHSRQTQ